MLLNLVWLIVTERTYFSNYLCFQTIASLLTDVYNKPLVMKKGIHPTTYRPVVFQDEAADFFFLTQSTVHTDATIKWKDGKTYPLVKLHISSASHPFFTGEEKIIDTEGRVDRFKARFEAASKRKGALANKAKKAATRANKKAQAEETEAAS